MKRLFLSSFAVLSSSFGMFMMPGIVHAELGAKEVTSVSFGVDEETTKEKPNLEVKLKEMTKDEKGDRLEIDKAQPQKENVTTSDVEQGRSTEMKKREESVNAEQDKNVARTVEEKNIVEVELNDNLINMDDLNSNNRLYVLRGLNLFEAYLFLKNNIIENLRICGNISNIAMQDDGSRRYLGDKGDRMIELLVKLFPSSAGSLNTESEASSENFWSQYDGISPELMAKFCSILIDYRNNLIELPSDEAKSALDPDGKINAIFKKNVEWLKANGFCEDKLGNRDIIKAICDCFDAISAADTKQGEMESLKRKYPGIDEKLSRDLGKRLEKLREKVENYNESLNDIMTHGDTWTVEDLENLIKKLNKNNQGQFDSADISKKDEIIAVVRTYLENEKAKLEKQIEQVQNQMAAADGVPLKSEDWLKAQSEWIEKKAEIEQNKNIIGSNYKPVLFLLSFIDTLKHCVDLEMQAREKIAKIRDVDREIADLQDDELVEVKTKVERLQEQKNSLLCEMPLYPEYLTERILMSYVIKTLNSIEDIKYFYDELVKRLAQNATNKLEEINQEVEIKKELDKIKEIKKLISNVNFQALSPYKDRVYENGKVLIIKQPDDKGQIAFEVDTFADCVDVTLRHVLNLLIYSDKKDWSLFLDEKNIDELRERLDKVIEAIKTNGKAPFYDLKTRMQIFLLYQKNSKRGADDQDTIIRTLWEYVICNMTEDTDDMYKIVYCKGNCEISSGYINMLKLMYNIAKVFNSGDEADKERLGQAKDNIDKLVRLKSYNEDIFNAAIVSVFSLFHPNGILKFKYRDCKYIDLRKDISGEVDISCEDGDDHLQFTIVFNDALAHAKVIHMPSNLQDVTREYICALDCGDQTGFYTVFSNNYLSFENPFSKNILYKKFKTLQALKSLQENPNDFSCVNDILEGAKLITIDSEKECLFYHLYFKYLFRYESDGSGNMEEYRRYNEPMFESLQHCLKIYDSSKNEIQDFLCLKVGKDKVKLLITEKGAQEENLEVPSQVRDGDGNVLNVIRLGNIFDIKVKKIVFKGDFDQLALDCFAFSENQCLKEVIFEGRVQNLSIGFCAFSGSNLTDFRIQNCDLTSLIVCGCAFFGSKLQNFIIPEGNKLTSLKFENYAFSRCKELRRFIIPETDCFTTLDVYNFVFWESSNLEEFKFPQSATNIVVGIAAFGQTCIKNFDIPCKVNRACIRWAAFEDAKLSKLIVPLCEYNLNIEDIGLKNGTVYVPINLRGNNMVEEFEKSGNTVCYYTDEKDLIKIRSIQV